MPNPIATGGPAGYVTHGSSFTPIRAMSLPVAHTRTAIRRRHALIAPEGNVPSNHPNWKESKTVVLISPAMGAGFTQMLIELTAKGLGSGVTQDRQLFFYVVEGAVEVMIAPSQAKNAVKSGGYAYLPPFTTYTISNSSGLPATILIFEKGYEPLTGVQPPGVFFWREHEVPGTPFLGDPDAMLQVLLPERPEFDMAVNIFRYKPGARLPFVETHVMEHGLLMLAGEGIYRLEDDWYPVQAGDVIWMAPYCPQWFAATGKSPASYIYYKDVNRAALPM